MRRQRLILFVILGILLCLFATSNLNTSLSFSLKSYLSYNNNPPPIQDIERLMDALEDVNYDAETFDYKQHHVESNVVKELKQHVRVLCWIMTAPDNLKKSNGRKCYMGAEMQQILFVTANDDSELPSVNLNVTAGRENLWLKTQRAFKYLYETDLDNYDWFLKADDDTFVIMENLRFMLLAYSPDDPIYFGCKLKPQVRHGYMSGGAGYVLSREALKRFVEEALNNTEQCKPNLAKDEDIYMGSCLEAVDVVAGDSRDLNGNHRMLPLAPTLHLDIAGTKKSTMLKWFHGQVFYPYNRPTKVIVIKYKQPLSDYVISFHYVDRPNLYSLYNQLYHHKVLGVTDGSLQFANTAAKNGTELIDLLRLMSQNTSRSYSDMVTERDRTFVTDETHKATTLMS